MIRKNAWRGAKTTLLPQSCRWITRDPIGLDGGENAYEFCSGNPLMLADPSGLQDQFSDQFNAYFGRPDPQGVSDKYLGPVRTWCDYHLGAWPDTLDTTLYWMSGVLPKTIRYTPENIETKWLRIGKTAKMIEEQIKKAGYPNDKKGGVDTVTAFVNTISESYNGVQAQLGAVNYRAHRRGHTIDIAVWNDITFNFFVYHIPEKVNKLINCKVLPYGWKNGPMSTVRQKFYWSIRAPGGN